jgi:hypothetical protein
MIQSSSTNPFAKKIVRIFLKSMVIAKGKDKPKATMTSDLTCRISAWLNQGIIIDDGSFIGFSTISSIHPVADVEEVPTHAD